MKRLLLCLLLSCILHSVIRSQNYRSVSIQTENYFSGNPGYMPPIASINAPVYVLKIDSFSLQGADTVYHTIRNFRGEYIANNCVDQQDTGFAGAQVHILSNGYDVFFNQYGDSIKILATAQPGQTFVIYTFPNGDYYEGTMTGYSFTFLPVNSDTIKIFQFQRKNSSGVNVNDPFNALEVYNSKNYGVIQTYDWLRFPDQISTFQLVGSAVAGTGINNLTAAEIFDFNLGDVFQHYQAQPYMVGPGSIYQKIWRQDSVISKYISAGGDTVIYTYDRMNFVESYTITPFNMTSAYAHDTVSETIILSQNLLNEYSIKFGKDSFFNITSNYWYGDGINGLNIQHNAATYNNRHLKSKYTPYYGNDSCMQETLATCYNVFVFGEGLGFIDRQTTQFGPCQSISMVYYSKGSETWGTPIDWGTLLSVANIKNENVINVYPNPAKDEITFGLPENFTGEIQIVTVEGKCIYQKLIFGPQQKVSLSELPTGIYFYKITSEKAEFYSGKFTVE